jgi:hypothetical protein
MDDEDKQETLYHGTTYDVAQRIFAQKAFEARETYFAATRELAAFFARRACAKSKSGHGAAVLKVVLYQSDLKLWKQNRLVLSKGFSEGDRPDLHGKTQLVFSAEAMRFLNRDMFPDDLLVEPVEPDASNTLKARS